MSDMNRTPIAELDELDRDDILGSLREAEAILVGALPGIMLGHANGVDPQRFAHAADLIQAAANNVEGRIQEYEREHDDE